MKSLIQNKKTRKKNMDKFPPFGIDVIKIKPVVFKTY